LYCLNAKSGKLTWKYEIADQIRCTPTVVEDRAFVAGCDGQLHIIDLTKGESVGSVDIESPTGVTPAVMGQLAFFGTEGGAFFAVDWKEAAKKWTYADTRRGQAIRSSPAVSKDAVVYGSRGKRVYALNSDTGKLLWEFPCRQRVDSSPVIAGQRVYVASADGRLYGLAIDSGKKQWEFEAAGGFNGSPAVANRRLVIATDEGVVYCFGD
jgi:outer membrane protein assembly factor BamB